MSAAPDVAESCTDRLAEHCDLRSIRGVKLPPERAHERNLGEHLVPPIGDGDDAERERRMVMKTGCRAEKQDARAFKSRGDQPEAMERTVVPVHRLSKTIAARDERIDLAGVSLGFIVRSDRRRGPLSAGATRSVPHHVPIVAMCERAMHRTDVTIT